MQYPRWCPQQASDMCDILGCKHNCFIALHESSNLINRGLATRGTFGGSLYKDYSILGSILGSPHFGKLPNIVGGVS